jgi:metal-responsive CopG/Arc/MetJ family transcriptional regulator
MEVYMTRLNVVFADDLARELRQLVPNRKRSRFIAEAVEEKLRLLKQVQAIQATAGSWSSEGRQDPEEEIRALRSTWEDRLKRLEPQNA